MHWIEDGKDAWILDDIPEDSEIEHVQCFCDSRGNYHIETTIIEKSSTRSLEKALSEAKRRITRMATKERERIQAREAREAARKKKKNVD